MKIKGPTARPSPSRQRKHRSGERARMHWVHMEKNIGRRDKPFDGLHGQDEVRDKMALILSLAR